MAATVLGRLKNNKLLESIRTLKAPDLPIYRLRLPDLRAFMMRQPPSFWLLLVYLGFEYVRPQTIYPSIAVLPWALFSIILCGIAFLVEGGRFRKLTFADGLLFLFSGIVVMSSLLAVYPSESFQLLYVYLSWVIIYFLISNIVNTRERFVVFMVVYMLYCLKMSQHGARSWAEAGFMFRTWGTTCAPGWFNNSGECGIQMVMYFSVSLFFFLALAAYWGRFNKALYGFMPLSAAVTILGSSSRGGVIGLAAVGLVILGRSKKRVKAFVYIALASVTLFLVMPQGFKERFTTMGDDGNSQLRLQYWKDGIKIARDYPVLGIGYNNWLKFYTKHYNAMGQLPHNIFVQAGAELGYTGLLAFIALIVATFMMNRRIRRIAKRAGNDRVLHYMSIGFDCALVGYMVSGFFVTVLYYPFFWINYAMVAALYNVALQQEDKLIATESAARWRAAGGSPAGDADAGAPPPRPADPADAGRNQAPAPPVPHRPAVARPRPAPLLSPEPVSGR